MYTLRTAFSSVLRASSAALALCDAISPSMLCSAVVLSFDLSAYGNVEPLGMRNMIS